MIFPFSFFKGKKGFELQFNWIFVIIGGAVFLGFFFTLMGNLSSNEESEKVFLGQKSFDSFIGSFSSSSEIQKILPFSEKIDFFCSVLDDDFSSEYYVGKSRQSSNYNYRVLFTPSSLSGDELIVKSVPFKSPYNVMPFSYLSNRNIEYVFVGEFSPLFSQISLLLPKNVTINKASSIQSYKDYNYDRTIFIVDDSNANVLSSSLSNFAKSSDDRVFAVVLDSKGDLVDSYGNIDFYSYSPKKGFSLEGSSVFMGPELLLGSIISHDALLYSCELKKIILRLNFTLDLNKKKLQKYSRELPDCYSRYDRMISDIDTIILLLSEKNVITSSDFSFEGIYPLIRRLSLANNDLLRTECISMY
jgi:hypothetical protein